MSSLLTPDTTAALLQASQVESKNKVHQLKKLENLEKIEEAAQDFEAMFISEMMKPMFEGIETAAPFGGGKGEEIFRSLMLQEYGKEMAKTGQLGIAEHVKQELIRIQEANSYE